MVSTVDGVDRARLARAIGLAEAAQRRSTPNPGVGCVVADTDGIVGEGATGEIGGPHAEVVALARAGVRARGATAYVTLSPCAHIGRTPPCTEALIAAGVGRVIVALADPNPAAAGGERVLAGRGVDVVRLHGDDVYARTVAAQLEAFLTSVNTGRPHVTLKLAQDADGGLQPSPGQRWITSPEARRAVHRWRSSADAVLVGVGTVLADDPRLDVRLVATEHQPRPVVLDSTLRTPAHAQVVGRGAVVVTGDRASNARRDALVAAGAQVLEVSTDANGRPDLRVALARLGERGIRRLFAEPGPVLSRSLLGEDLVDRLVLHIAGSSTTSRLCVPVDAERWEIERLGGVGPDSVIQVQRRAPTRVSNGEAA